MISVGLEEVNLPHAERVFSEWVDVCPVTLEQGDVVKGSAEFVVSYAGKVYFCASQQAKDMFLENPERFLSKPPKMPNTYSIALVGLHTAGKSTLAKQLAEKYGWRIVPKSDVLKKWEEVKAEEKAFAARNPKRQRPPPSPSHAATNSIASDISSPSASSSFLRPPSAAGSDGSDAPPAPPSPRPAPEPAIWESSSGAGFIFDDLPADLELLFWSQDKTSYVLFCCFSSTNVCSLPILFFVLAFRVDINPKMIVCLTVKNPETLAQRRGEAEAAQEEVNRSSLLLLLLNFHYCPPAFPYPLTGCSSTRCG